REENENGDRPLREGDQAPVLRRKTLGEPRAAVHRCKESEKSGADAREGTQADAERCGVGPRSAGDRLPPGATAFISFADESDQQAIQPSYQQASETGENHFDRHRFTSLPRHHHRDLQSDREVARDWQSASRKSKRQKRSPLRRW